MAFTFAPKGSELPLEASFVIITSEFIEAFVKGFIKEDFTIAATASSFNVERNLGGQWISTFLLESGEATQLLPYLYKANAWQ